MPSRGRSARWLEAFWGLQTSAKIIFILTLALMPLGVIALLASLQTSRTADEQRRAELRVVVTEASRKLATEMTTDVYSLRQAVASIEAQSDISETCSRTQALLRTHGAAGVPFALYGPGSSPLCATRGLSASRPATLMVEQQVSLVRNGDTLDLIVMSPSGGTVALARYSPAMVARFARPEGYGLPYEMAVEIDGTSLVVLDRSGGDMLRRTETASGPVGFGNLSLSMTVASVPFGAAEALLTFLPLLMWASASVIGFFIVDRLLIRPLKTLRLAVGNYQPGSARRILAETPAVEIRELEASFTAFADKLADREGEVELALNNQVRLTREVHHRVKNNLQVIASLISLHARDSASNDAAKAYASIQRRVDALAIVHRNHYAELEANNGIDAKSLLSELVANFRANAKSEGGTPMVTLAADASSVSQDVATPLAFLFTELAEASLLTDPTATIEVMFVRTDTPDTARFSVSSSAFKAEGFSDRSAFRIIAGLARQLRATLNNDADHTSYNIVVSTLGPAAQ